MKETKIKTNSFKTSYLREFKSLNEFEDYISNTPLNEVFKWEKLQSVNNSYGFTQTHTYDEVGTVRQKSLQKSSMLSKIR